MSIRELMGRVPMPRTSEEYRQIFQTYRSGLTQEKQLLIRDALFWLEKGEFTPSVTFSIIHDSTDNELRWRYALRLLLLAKAEAQEILTRQEREQIETILAEVLGNQTDEAATESNVRKTFQLDRS